MRGGHGGNTRYGILCWLTVRSWKAPSSSRQGTDDADCVERASCHLSDVPVYPTTVHSTIFVHHQLSHPYLFSYFGTTIGAMGLFDSFLSKSRASKSETSSSSKGKASECQADSDNTGQSVEANARPSDTVAEEDLAAKNSPAIPAVDQSVQPPETSVTEGSLPCTGVVQNDETQGRYPLANHTGRGLMRMSGFLTLLRSHRRQHPATVLDHPGSNNQPVHPAFVGNLWSEKSLDYDSVAPDFLQVFQQAGYLADLGSRKVSDKTIQSADSELTSATICRHPSQRTSTPIILPDQRPECQNPFDENAEGVERLPGSDPFSDPLDMVNTRHERQPSSEYDDAGPKLSGSFEHAHTRRPQTPFIARHSADGSLSQGSSDLHTCSNGSDWSACVDQHTATIAFNELAPQLNLEPLPQNQSSGGPCGRQHPSGQSVYVDPLGLIILT